MTRSEKQDWERIRVRGRSRFVVYAGVLSLGLPFGTIMLLLDLLLRFSPADKPKPLWQVPTEFAFLALFFGLTMGITAWRLREREYARPSLDDRE